MKYLQSTIPYADQYLIGRDRDYLDLNLNYAASVMKLATIVSMFPRPLKPYVVISCHESESLIWSQDCCTSTIQPSFANFTGNGIHQTYG